GFSATRDDAVHYGFCRVYVPKAHKIGSLGSPWWKRLANRIDDRLKLLIISDLSREVFWQSVSSYLSTIDHTARHAVIFIHGSNVSFENCALRAAQIGFDLSIRGVMAFFSWPSRGRLRGYIADSASVEASEPEIARFLLDFVTYSRAKMVHIIAHSM